MMNKGLFYSLLSCSLLLFGCSDIESGPSADKDQEMGEEIQFTSFVPDVVSQTRSQKSDWTSLVNSYSPVYNKYHFTIEMLKEGNDGVVASGKYEPNNYTNVGSTIDQYDGLLTHVGTESPLYWPDNVNRWGFRATANNNPLVADQTTQQKWLDMDYLVGHSYLPIWIGDEDTGMGTNPNVMQYKSSKEWYADNKKAKDQSGLMVNSDEDYKKVPLYMNHQRAWITVILKAGEGVSRDALNYSTASRNIRMTINSYAAGQTDALAISPWPREYKIDYPKDKNGDAATNVSTTRYDAIVEPHNYATKKEEEVIAKINLQDQNFSFYASNDNRYLSGHTEADMAAADNDYNLEAGKHLIITATLSRESRKILITAWVEDWTEVATSTICDDYGQNGDPIVIKSRSELKEFLVGSKNKAGNVGIISLNEINLDVEGEEWPSTYKLNATLNLAGCTLKTKNTLFAEMSSSANLVNGTVEIQEGAELKYAIASYNDGTIERINVTTEKAENSTARATVAGMVGRNCGTIFQCNSVLPVYANEPTTIVRSDGTDSMTGYIGGIAAISKSHDESSMAVIDGCSVNASVNGAENKNIKGGGIAGFAQGRVSNCTFEYGITVSQDITYFKNIFSEAGTLRAYNNSWPTIALNYISTSTEGQSSNPNNYSGQKFDAVLDCQHELDLLLNSSYNTAGKNYRVSKSFEVRSTNDQNTDWTHGTVKSEDREAGVNNVSFNLDGNGMTITLTGVKTVKTTDGENLDNGNAQSYTTAPMLFNYILGEVKNLTIYLEKPLVASPSVSTNDKYNAEDAIAPLAYAVYGSGKITGVNVKAASDAYIQSSTPAGLVVWAYGGATISECKVNVPVRLWLPNSMGGDGRHYAGGVVACAAKATLSQCQYLGNNESSLSGSQYSTSATKSANFYYGGIVGGTSMKENEVPQLTINDCSSWFITTKTEGDLSSRGGIIGFCCYVEASASSKILNGMAEGNQGNWWQESSSGACKWASGYTEEKAIGKRNAKTPEYTVQ